MYNKLVVQCSSCLTYQNNWSYHLEYICPHSTQQKLSVTSDLLIAYNSATKSFKSQTPTTHTHTFCLIFAGYSTLHRHDTFTFRPFRSTRYPIYIHIVCKNTSCCFKMTKPPALHWVHCDFGLKLRLLSHYNDALKYAAVLFPRNINLRLC